MTRRPILLVLTFLLMGVIVYAATHDEWGRPLGPRYSGPEVQPRQVAIPTCDLNPDERATITVFEQASRSVVFIANTAIRRGPWSLNLLEVPKARAPASSGTLKGTSSRIFTLSTAPMRSPSH